MYIADGVPLVEIENDDTLLLREGVYVIPYDMKYYNKQSIKSRKQNIYRIRNTDVGSIQIDHLLSFFPFSSRLEFNNDEDRKNSNIGKIRSLIKRWEHIVDHDYIPKGQSNSSLKCLTSGKFFMYMAEKFSLQNIYAIDSNVCKSITGIEDNSKKIEYVMSVVPTAGTFPKNGKVGWISKYTKLYGDDEGFSEKDKRDLQKLIDMWVSYVDEKVVTQPIIEQPMVELVDIDDTENTREHVSLKDGFYFLIQILLLGGLFAWFLKWFFQF